jgi:hypothetical protein
MYLIIIAYMWEYGILCIEMSCQYLLVKDCKKWEYNEAVN